MLTCPAGETYEAIKVLQESPLSPEACRVMTAFPGAGCAVDKYPGIL